jgi:hypothetical protein
MTCCLSCLNIFLTKNVLSCRYNAVRLLGHFPCLQTVMCNRNRDLTIQFYMKNIILIFVVVTVQSCSDKRNLKEVFITDKNEYWTYYSQRQNGYLYFQFHENGTYDKFERNLTLLNNEGDLVNEVREWSISNDSILNWDGEKYDLISGNEKAIVVMYLDSVKIPKYVFFIKQKANERRLAEPYFEQKRELNSKKYIREH